MNCSSRPVVDYSAALVDDFIDAQVAEPVMQAGESA